MQCLCKNSPFLKGTLLIFEVWIIKKVYRAADHKLLWQILKKIEGKYGTLEDKQSLIFITRLSANFSQIRKLFDSVYHGRRDCERQFQNLILILYTRYRERSRSLKALDRRRENEPEWLLSNQWVGMSLYVEHFSNDLKGFLDRIDYLQELGVNLIHLMPLLKTPRKEGDGGYAVSNYRKVSPDLGSMEDISNIARVFRKRGMLLALDLVLNHTSDKHKWAKKAKQGDKKYREYYYMYPDRSVPDLFEAHMPEIFPDTAPGNFTFLPKQKKWVMTVFHRYQWDLNYRNPQVLIEMVDVLLFLANQGVDILRLDAAPYLWKEIGTGCQNLAEAHTLLKLMRRCAEVVSPGVKFIAEAIVTPTEIIKYFGQHEDPECDIAYNATLMALIWNSLATTKANLLYQSLNKLPEKPTGATWINYARCHDDIGLGFDDEDIYQVGFDAKMHRAFLLDYYTGKFQGSQAKGALFMHNQHTGDARISGSLASLAGLEKAIADKSVEQTMLSINKIILVHALIMSYGGLPMIYSGDEIGLLNQYDYLSDPGKKADNRWMHRGDMDWNAAEKRNVAGSVQSRIFNEIKKLIEIRKDNLYWSDHNSSRLIHSGNQHILAFTRSEPDSQRFSMLVLANFDSNIQSVGKDLLIRAGLQADSEISDLFTGSPPTIFKGFIELQPYQFYFIVEKPE